MGAYNVGNVQSTQGQSMMQGAEAAAAAIRRWKEDRKKQEFNDGVFSYLADKQDESGQSYIPTKAIERWHSMSPDAQAGTLSGAMYSFQQDAKKKAEQPRMELSPAEMERATAAGVVPVRQSRGSFQYVPTPEAAAAKREAKNADSWKKVNGDIHAVSGAHLGDWNRAENKRVEKDANGLEFFTAELPGDPVPAGMKPEVAALMGLKQPRKLSIPRADYEALHGRVTALQQQEEDATGANDGGTAAPAPAGGRTMTATEQQAMAWAKANPQDPRTPAILKKLGLQ